MSIFNPWGELRALKARLAAEEEAYRVEEEMQQTAWAAKQQRILELERSSASLRRNNEKLRDQLKKAHERIDYLYALSQKNSSLYATETHRNAKLAATLKEQDALIVKLHEKVIQAADPRDPKTGRFIKKEKAQ